MKITKVVLFALLFGAFGASNADALTLLTKVNVAWATNHSAQGGEFILTTTGPSSLGIFNSFCIEFDEHVNIGGNYFYNTATYADDGGLNTPIPDPFNDPISKGTAWLYSKFAAGTLTGYTASATDQSDLQNAFWMLEGELAVASNPWLTVVTTAIGPNIYDDAVGAEFLGVGVMNLWVNDDGTGHAQDMLYQLSATTTSAPDGGTTLSLLGLAMFGIATVSRRLRRV